MADLDLLFLVKNRFAFTQEAWCALLQNTDWSLVSKAVAYDDGSVDGSDSILAGFDEVRYTNFGSPVAAFNDFVMQSQAKLVAKVDNDTVLPPGWLDVCLEVLNADPDLQILGLEAKVPLGDGPYTCEEADHVGGIFVARREVFSQHPLPSPDGVYYGFTDWQREHNVKRGWISPGIPVFLLDRLPHAPWILHSAEYERAGWQRFWQRYDFEEDSALWAWWERRCVCTNT